MRNKRRIPSFLLPIFFTLVVGGILIFWILGFIYLTIGRSFDSCPSDKPEIFEGMADIKLPPSTQRLSSNCGGMQGWWVEGTFDIKPDDLDYFLQHSNLDLPYAQNGYTEQTQGGLFPEQETMQSWLYQEYEVYEYYKQILIDTSDSTVYRVYVHILGG